MHHRPIIDLRGVLLAAGLVSCTDNAFSYMVVLGEDPAEARATRVNMRRRAGD